jgi:hypothetical protein
LAFFSQSRLGFKTRLQFIRKFRASLPGFLQLDSKSLKSNTLKPWSSFQLPSPKDPKWKVSRHDFPVENRTT